MGNELDLGVDTYWTNHLLPMKWHAVTDGVVFNVDIRVEETYKLVTNIEIFTLNIAQNVLPNNLRLANG